MNMPSLLTKIIADNELHTHFLNTLSFLENCGARKIAAAEHPTLVKKEVLKHAAEEFRHALHLKRQMKKIHDNPPLDYSNLLGGWKTYHYLDRLEAKICRFSKRYAYPLVTYAIEKRAENFYPLYDKLLKEKGSKVTVKCILLEEQGHLEEMEKEILKIPQGQILKTKACQCEEELYKVWVNELI